MKWKRRAVWKLLLNRHVSHGQTGSPPRFEARCSLGLTLLLVLALSGCRPPYRAAGIEMKAQRRILELVNQARTPEQLTLATGMDGEIARRIIQLRARYGPNGYRTLDEIKPLWTIPGTVLDSLIFGFSSAVYGKWVTLPYGLQHPNGTGFSAAHSAMLCTGKVILFPESDAIETVLWDPADEVNPQFSYPDNQPSDRVFCSGHSFLSDGRLLVVGGGGNYPSNAIKRAWKFDPTAGTNGRWERTSGDMTFERWYPTTVTLGYPRVLVASGMRPGTPHIPTSMEIYDETTDQFQLVTSPSGNPTGAEYEMEETYPGLHLLPTGRILYTHTGWGHGSHDETRLKAAYFDFTSSNEGQWTDMTKDMKHYDRTEGMSVQILTPSATPEEYTARVAVFGGGYPDTSGRSRAEAIETSALSASTPWQSLPQMSAPRFHASSVLLPDGKVLVFGGAEHDDDGTAGQTSTEIFDPVTNTFAPADDLQYSRGYHSVTVLLPSAKVMLSGGINGPNERKIEIFSPPYLFKGPRPKIMASPSLVHHGDTFQIQTTQGPHITKVVLVRPMAFTHHTDSDQRVLELKFTRTGNTVTATAPRGVNTVGTQRPAAPRGYYMLFVLNDKGIPSTAKFILLH